MSTHPTAASLRRAERQRIVDALHALERTLTALDFQTRDADVRAATHYADALRALASDDLDRLRLAAGGGQ